MRGLTRVSALVLVTALLTGCAAGKAFSRGEDRAKVGDWDSAVTYYRTALQEDPDRAEYRIALERAMLNASRLHFDSARALEAKDQLDAALLEYRKTVEFDPGNTQALDRIVQLEKTIRDRAEASRPKPAITLLREQARQTSATPLLNPASRAPLDIRFTQASLRDVLTFISNATGINVIYDASFNDRPVTVQLTGSIEQALNTLLSSNGLFYTVLDERTIVVAQDSAPNRLKYERQVALTIPLSYVDATELSAMLTAITRTTTGVTIPPVIVPNKTNNSITIRATEPVVAVIRELVLTNDKPRAEITLDVEILEVSRSRTKELGLNLTQNQIGGIFSPEKLPPSPPATTDGQPFNLNTITQGVSTADFYLTVPQAIVKFLQTDVNTRFLAQTQLRGSEGAQLELKVGADEPYLTTSFSPIAGGGANVNPLSSYTFRTVGINVRATPRLITDEGDILLELVMSNDTLGPPRLVGGQLAPSFPTRSVTTKLRLRDGESHLLAGLLQDDERRSMTGFPGVMSVPILRSIFSASDDTIAQTDIVMLLTPRIIRTHEYTARDLSPIYVGTNQNFGLTGPPPLIAAPPAEPEVAAPAPGAPAPAPGAAAPPPIVPPQGTPVPMAQPGATVPTAPPGGTPGQVTPPQAQAVSPPADTQAQQNLTAPSPTALAPPAQISVTAPAGEVRVGAGPYLVPVYASNVSRASTVTLTITYNPAVLRVRNVQEGSFLRQGSLNVVFTPQTDAATGRVDLAFVRTGDKVGASGTGLVAALQFDAVGSGNSQVAISGVLTNPTGGTIPAQFIPATVVVR